MKIAITADLHLTTRSEHAERYAALANILDQMLAARINTLVIAGDLFDASSQNYAEFDQFCKESKYRTIKILILPGNHDARLTNSSLTAENVQIVSEPTIKTFNSAGLKFLLLPYKPEKTIGEFMAAHAQHLPANQWVLISHGDWAEGMRDPNPYEPGVYMPLTRTDIETYKPARALLGHIHKPWDGPRVHYAGSPCGVAIDETGRRRFLILDTETAAVKSQTVASEVIFFNEAFTILPVRDEAAYLKNQIASRIKSWGLEDREYPKVRLQVKVSGYTADKRALLTILKENFRGFTFHRGQEPDLCEVAVAEDINRAEIANQVSSWIEKLDWQPAADHPDKHQILLEALHVIYGT